MVGGALQAISWGLDGIPQSGLQEISDRPVQKLKPRPASAGHLEIGDMMNSTTNPRPFLFGSMGAPNTGDEALCLSWMEHYYVEYQVKEFFMFSLSEYKMKVIFGEETRFKINAPDKLFWFVYYSMQKSVSRAEIIAQVMQEGSEVGQEILGLLRDVTHIHVIGGGYLADHDSNIAIMLEILRIYSDKMKIPVIFTGISFGYSEESSKFMNDLLFRADDYIDFRDDSWKHLTGKYIAQQTFDDFVMAQSLFEPAIREEGRKKYAAICMPGSLYQNWSDEYNNYLINFVSAFSRHLLENEGFHRIYIVSSCYSDDDWRIGRDILRIHPDRLWSRVILVDFSLLHPSEIRKFIGNADMILAGRLHFTLMSVGAQVPTVSIETSYKIEQLKSAVKNIAFGAIHTRTEEYEMKLMKQALEAHATGQEETVSNFRSIRTKKAEFIQRFLDERVFGQDAAAP